MKTRNQEDSLEIVEALIQANYVSPAKKSMAYSRVLNLLNEKYPDRDKVVVRDNKGTIIGEQG